MNDSNLRTLVSAGLIGISLLTGILGCGRSKAPETRTNRLDRTLSGDTASTPHGLKRLYGPANLLPVPSDESSEVILAVHETLDENDADQPAESGRAGTDRSADVAPRAIDSLRILLGTWRGVTDKSYGGFKAMETAQWSWQAEANAGRPTLVMKSTSSPYLREARLNYAADSQMFQCQIVDCEGRLRNLSGHLSTSPSGKLQHATSPKPEQRDRAASSDRYNIGFHPIIPTGGNAQSPGTYCLELTEPAGAQAGTRWRLVFRMQRDHYDLDIERPRIDGAFERFDRVSFDRDISRQ